MQTPAARSGVPGGLYGPHRTTWGERGIGQWHDRRTGEGGGGEGWHHAKGVCLGRCSPMDELVR